MEIILGASNGTKSYIKSKNSILESIAHGSEDLTTVIDDFYLSLNNGQIIIKNLRTDEIFVRCETNCEHINKNDLKLMLVDGVNSGFGSKYASQLRVGKKFLKRK